MQMVAPAADEPTQGPKYPSVVVTLTRREAKDCHTIRARVKTALYKAHVHKDVFEAFVSATTFSKAPEVLEKAGEICKVEVQ